MRKKYSQEIKNKAINLRKSGFEIKLICSKLEIPFTTICNWTKDLIKETDRICNFCKLKFYSLPNLRKHEKSCYLNPNNLRYCKNCGGVVKNTDNKEFCSKSCANKGRFNNSYKGDSPEKYREYRSICFAFHAKECVICGENKIVEVHHLNGNNKDNDKFNLIPLCPTHHKYWHSRYRNLIENNVLEYLTRFKINYIIKKLMLP